MMPYDLIREEVIALSGVLIQVVALAGFLSSQDDPPRGATVMVMPTPITTTAGKKVVQ